VVVALASVLALQARPATAVMPECEITIGVEKVPVQAEPVAVPVKLSAVVGEALTASLPEESKIRVLGVARADGKDAQTFQVTLNTSEAVAGTYELVVRDGQTECKGRVQIGDKTEG